MPLKTKRLNLRIFTSQDFQDLRELDSDPVVLRYRSRKAISPEMTQEFLEKARQAHLAIPRTFYAYAITRREDSQWLGQCGMTEIPSPRPNHKQVFLWYSLLPRYWKLGYMTEAAQALIRVGFDNFGLELIEGACTPDNVASARVLEKAGLAYKGQVVREDRAGKKHHLLLYEITSTEYDEGQWPNVALEQPY